MSLDSFRVIGVRADGSRVTLWQGDSLKSANDAERQMKRLGTYFGGCFVECEGQTISQVFAYNRPE